MHAALAPHVGNVAKSLLRRKLRGRQNGWLRAGGCGQPPPIGCGSLPAACCLRSYIVRLVTTPPSPGPARLTPRQVWLWGLAFAVIVALIVLYFVYGRTLRPPLGSV